MKRFIVVAVVGAFLVAFPLTHRGAAAPVVKAEVCHNGHSISIPAQHADKFIANHPGDCYLEDAVEDPLTGDCLCVVTPPPTP